MKKLLLSTLLVLSGYISFALCSMYSDYTTACIKYNATTGKISVELTHNSPPSSPLWEVNCGYANFYTSPYTTWLYVKNPSAAGFFGPFEVTGNVAHDPTTGKAYTYYDVTIPGFSTQECYEVYAVSNRTWYASDPSNSWGFVPSSSLDPTISPYNNWRAPDTKVYEIYSTQIPYTACLCSESDTIPPCNSNFILQTRTASDGPFGPGTWANLELNEYHPLSTYIFEWDGITGFFTYDRTFPISSPPGSHKVCITEVTPSGDSCKTCIEFCSPDAYNVALGGGSSMMRKNIDLEVPLLNKNSIELYPNPTNGISEIKFNLLKKESIEVNVTDITGKKIMVIPSKEYEIGVGKMELNTNTLPVGLYQVHVRIGNELITKKLSVVK